MEFFGQILTEGKSLIAVLIDPDKISDLTNLKPLVKKIEFAKVDFIFVGGSSVCDDSTPRTQLAYLVLG